MSASDERAPRRVLFLCTANSARSQMAEGLARHLAGDRLDIASAGSAPASVHPLAIEVMAERGIDISGHRSKHLEELLDSAFDDVVTVCDRAATNCPVFPGPARRHHWPLEDPAAAPSEGRRAAFLRVREELEERIEAWLDAS